MQRTRAAGNRKAQQTQAVVRVDAKAKSLCKTLLVWGAERGKGWGAALQMCRGSCGAGSGCACSSPATHTGEVTLPVFLVLLQGLSSAALLHIATDQQEPLNESTKLGLTSELCVCHSTPAPNVVLLQFWGVGTLPLQARANSARENCRNSSRNTF